MGPTPISVEGLDGVVPMRLRDVAPEVNRITGSIVDSSLAVQRALGSRLLEKPYEIALTHELSLRGHRVQRQVPIEVEYRGLRIGNAYSRISWSTRRSWWSSRPWRTWIRIISPNSRRASVSAGSGLTS